MAGASGRLDGVIPEENPAWVRACVEAFKKVRNKPPTRGGKGLNSEGVTFKDKCLLSHEIRTMDNWRRFNRRQEISAYRHVVRTVCQSCDSKRRSRNAKSGPEGRCTCHDMLAYKLPHLSQASFPPELWGQAEAAGPGSEGAGQKRKAGAVSRGRLRGKIGMGLEIDEGAAALLGEEADAGPIRLTKDDMNRRDEEAAGSGQKEGAGGSDKEDGDEGLDDGEDMEDGQDYAANIACDDDEDLTNDEGGDEDDEEMKHGTF